MTAPTPTFSVTRYKWDGQIRVGSDTIIVLFTNCQGEWTNKETTLPGYLRKEFPNVYHRYRDLCQEHIQGDEPLPSEDLLCRCHLLESRPWSVEAEERRIFIACLFVSYGNGHRNFFSNKPGRDGKTWVLLQIDAALARLKSTIQKEAALASREGATDKRIAGSAPKSLAYGSGWTESGEETVIYSCRKNVSEFGTKAKQVEALIRKHFADWEGEWYMLE
ncbi:hypothetical protein F4779DRAFT_612876 [Xylariaceae sp. FL0662B]|nr:hypothetical protein F4779DRAFT_612876 [Xylariaceae sp. FL0662B]